MGLKNVLKQPLVRKFHKEYKQAVEASLDSFEAFLHRQQAEEAAVWSGLSSDTFEAIDKLQEDLLFLQITPGKLLEGAKRTFARHFYDNSNAVLAYCDEFCDVNGDIITGFKPEWSPDTFLNRFYFDGLVIVRKNEFEKEVPDWSEITNKDRWWQVIYDYLVVKSCFNKINNDCNGVLHVPQVLYERHENVLGNSYNTDNGRASVRGDNGDKITGVLKLVDCSNPSGITVIIPSKDHPGLLEKCIGSIIETVENMRLQIIVVDNGSNESNRSKITSLLDSFKAVKPEFDFEYIYEEMPFNFSEMCNKGAAKAVEEQLLFLNDDIECVHKGWLEDMSFIAARPYVGAVGSKLLYPDGKRIQHAGITNLPIGPVHKLQFLNDEDTYYDEYNRGVRNVLAVTGACLLIRREVYEEVGGMSEDLAVAFNDVDLCYRLHEKGYYQVVLQEKPLYHHESLSRGDDESTEKWQRLMKERATLYGKHPVLEGVDPFYNKNLNRKGLDVHILPEYVQGKQNMLEVLPRLLQKGVPESAREDNCLMVRAEICRELVGDNEKIELYGYGVVLGSDNSLFSKELLLRNEEGTVYHIPLKGSYRADLVRNMPDQQNVAMSGFWVCFEKNLLPAGNYTVGMYATDRTGGTKLFSYTGRVIEI